MNRRGSATDAIGLAIEHVKTVLFRPFDMARWVMLGFIAFVAYLGDGGYSYNFRLPSGRDEEFLDLLRSMIAWMMENRLATAILLFFGFLLLLVIVVLFQWLS